MLKLKSGIAEDIGRILKSEFALDLPQSEILNMVQDGGIEGVDVECRIAFRVAKQLRMAPQEIAQRIMAGLKSEYYTVNNANGYLNFAFTDKFYSEFVERGEGDVQKTNVKVIAEYPSVNPNKPLHIGHVRNAIIGDCVSNILEMAGHDVVRMNYIDDLGLQVAQSLLRYLEGNTGSPQKKFDHYLGEQYVEVAKLMETDADARKRVEEIMKHLEEGDAEICGKGREMCEKCVYAQGQTLQALRISHDVLVWESDIVHARLLQESLELLEKNGILVRKSEGKYKDCMVVELSTLPQFKGMEDADKVFVRANGVATYTAKDIAFQMWKFGIIGNGLEFCKANIKQVDDRQLHTSCAHGLRSERFNNAHKVINIIGVEQEYPQTVIKVVLEKAGFGKQAGNYVHIAYGHAKLKEGRFSGRKGTWIGYSADELIKESITKAYTLVSDRFKNYDEDEKKRISESVGIGAIRFSFIRLGPEKELVFDWERALNFEGDSGPYLQYSYARAHHILENEGMDEGWKGRMVFKEKEERRLIGTLAVFDEVFAKASDEIAPHRIADYSLELCSDFNSFYANCRVIGEEKDVSESRKRLVARYKETLQKCLRILGIPIIENM